eukprot:201613_1
MWVGNMVYNPPQNTGQMNIDCYGGRQSCYLLNIVSLSTRQINVNCGNINSNSSSGQGECYHTTVFGPVLPFAVDETDFRFNTMYNDSYSVVLQCHQRYDCDSFAINVPFGPHQVTTHGYTRDLNRYSFINYHCGYDYFGSTWNTPDRDLYCKCKLELRKIV